MRNISAASLAKLATKVGTEPVIVLDIYWDSVNATTYSQKTYPGISLGKILEHSGIEDVVNYSKSTTSQSITVTMDDTDGHFLSIFGSVDIHNRPVNVYQWFEGIPFSDRFLLFSGTLCSPCLWKESDRTFQFTVLSRVQDQEVGFSPEEGFFSFTPDTIIGKVWPLVFGYVIQLPTVLIDDIPHGNRRGSGRPMTKSHTGIHDPALEKQIAANEAQAAFCIQLAQYFFVIYLQQSSDARDAGELDFFDPIQKGKGPHSSQAQKALSEGNKNLLKAQQLRAKNTALERTLSLQKQHEMKQLEIANGHLFPQGSTQILNIAGAYHTGYFSNDTFNIKTATHPNDELTSGMTISGVAPTSSNQTGTTGATVAGVPVLDTNTDPVINRNPFFFAQAGVPLLLAQDPQAYIINGQPIIPLRYIAASGIYVTVEAVYAFRQFQGYKQIYQVPDAYYEVVQIQFGTLPVTMIYLKQPLSTISDSSGVSLGYEDELWCTLSSPIGPNPVDIMIWLIQNYSNHSYDLTSFTAVKNILQYYPANFALTSKMNLIKLLNDIAYQSRCIVYLKDGIFYIKYLPQEDTPVATITEADVIFQSMEVGCTETEDLVTKYVAKWKASYFQKNTDEVILNWNILYYGMKRQDFDYYIYNTIALVQKSATFWMIRGGNTYKTMQIKVPFSKLNIETMDTVTLNFSHPWVSNGPINAIVESAQIDVANYEITLKLWIPILVGQMTKYTFAYPAGMSEQDIWPSPQDILDGRAGNQNEFNKGVQMPAGKFGAPMTGDTGNGGQLQVTFRPLNWGADPSYVGDAGNAAPGVPTILGGSLVTPLAGLGPYGKPVGTTMYQFDKATKTTPTTLSQPTSGATAPGKVFLANDDKTYQVNVYWGGMSQPPTLIKKVKQVAIADGDTLSVGTAVMVTSISYAKISSLSAGSIGSGAAADGSSATTGAPTSSASASGGSIVIEYYMQAPVWAAPNPPSP